MHSTTWATPQPCLIYLVFEESCISWVHPGLQFYLYFRKDATICMCHHPQLLCGVVRSWTFCLTGLKLVLPISASQVARITVLFSYCTVHCSGVKKCLNCFLKAIFLVSTIMNTEMCIVAYKSLRTFCLFLNTKFIDKVVGWRAKFLKSF
jgi:hypothetical protein